MSMPWRSWGGGDSPGQEEKLLHFAGEVGRRALGNPAGNGSTEGLSVSYRGRGQASTSPCLVWLPWEAVDLDRAALSLKAVPREQLSGQLVSPIPSSWGLRRTTWAPLSLYELPLTQLFLIEQ